MQSSSSSIDFCAERYTVDGSPSNSSSLKLFYPQLFVQLLDVADDLQKFPNDETQVLSDLVNTQSEINENLQKQVEDLRNKLKFWEETKPVTRKKKRTVEDVNYDNEIVPTWENKARDLSSQKAGLIFKVTKLKQDRQDFNLSVAKRLNGIQRQARASFIPSFRASTAETSDANRTEDITVVERKDKFTEILQNEFKCAICDEFFIETIMLTTCGHAFCQHCITKWEQINQSCPICLTDIGGTIAVPFIDSYLNNILRYYPTLSQELENWLGISKERKGLNHAGLEHLAGPAPSRVSESESWESSPERPTRNGFDRGWTVEEIIAPVYDPDGILIKWSGHDVEELVPMGLVRRMVPQMLIDFYERQSRYVPEEDTLDQ